jgi:hypothetical protein
LLDDLRLALLADCLIAWLMVLLIAGIDGMMF